MRNETSDGNENTVGDLLPLKKSQQATMTTMAVARPNNPGSSLNLLVRNSKAPAIVDQCSKSSPDSAVFKSKRSARKCAGPDHHMNRSGVRCAPTADGDWPEEPNRRCYLVYLR